MEYSEIDLNIQKQRGISMEKWRRSERVSAMTKYLLERPNTLISLNVFTDLFHAAKSSISEDIGIIRNVFSEFGYGKVETLAGANGGAVSYTHLWNTFCLYSYNIFRIQGCKILRKNLAYFLGYTGIKNNVSHIQISTR